MASQQIFLLSPANCNGLRAKLLMSATAQFALAQRLRSPQGATLGEVFSFISGLYFRGKLAYAQAFSRTQAGIRGSLVITASRGLVPVDATIRLADLLEHAFVPVDPSEPRYAEPLLRDAKQLLRGIAADDRIILLGSIATDKYGPILTGTFGERLLFPREFVGRGDMSRGGLMLRSAAEGRELAYAPLSGAARRGKRPPRLAPRTKPV
jgi:hypothetical protein